jgi:hypothetical protein
VNKLTFLPLALAALAFAPADVSACSCVSAGQGPVPYSAAVFRGTVQAVHPNLSNASEAVTFRVTNVLQGRVTTTKTIVTAGRGGLCGFSFELGSEYFVVAYPKDGSPLLSTGRCTGTQRAGTALPRFLRHLGPGYPPFDPPAAAHPLWLWLSPLLTVAFLAFAVWDSIPHVPSEPSALSV